jgi:threonine 3-dehydrogenase
LRAIVKTQRGPGGELKTVPDPRPGPHDVLVEVEAASICGTDVHLWEWNEWAQNRVKRIPLILGHEVAGKIIELGRDVEGHQVGDRVSAETHIVDGTCYQCRTGRMHVCENLEVFGVDHDGVFAEYALIPQRNAWTNDPHLDPALASMQEPLGNAIHSLLPEDTTEDLAGKDVLVTGCGPIGLLAIPAAKMFGAARVVATEVNPLRISLARKMGADAVFDPHELGAGTSKAVKEALGGVGADVALEMSGHPTSLQILFDSIKPGARVSLLGLFSRPVPFDFDDAVITKAARIHGIYGRRMFETWYSARNLLARESFREKMASIITHRLPIPELPRAMELILSQQTGKVSLRPEW